MSQSTQCLGSVVPLAMFVLLGSGHVIVIWNVKQREHLISSLTLLVTTILIFRTWEIQSFKLKLWLTKNVRGDNFWNLALLGFCVCCWFVLWCLFICDSICVLYIFFGTINVFVLLEQSPPSLQSFGLITIIIIVDIIILIDDHRGLVWVSSRGKKDSLPNGCRRPFASTALVRMILEC